MKILTKKRQVLQAVKVKHGVKPVIPNVKLKFDDGNKAVILYSTMPNPTMTSTFWTEDCFLIAKIGIWNKVDSLVMSPRMKMKNY